MIDGRLSLITPEGVRLQLTPAGPAARAWAWGLDFLLWALAMVLLAWMTGRALGMGVFLVLLFISYWGYPVLCEVYWNGHTLGKRVMGLQVRRSDGLPVGWRESMLRNLLLVADFLPLLYLAGLLSMVFDRQFRRLGDIVAGTVVVYQERAPKRPAAPAAGAAPAVPPLPLPFPLAPAQQRALADLFEREPQLPPARMLELAGIAAPLTGLEGEASLQRLRAYAAGLKQ